MNNLKYLVLILLSGFIALPGSAYATIVLPKILGNNMVLQRNKPVPIWGTATAGEMVTVTFSGQVKKTVAGADGNWKVILDPMPASAKGNDMEITGTNSTKLSNILVGEVWLCSGQSNMQYEMRKNSKVNKPDTSTANSPVDELERAHNPQIRIFLATQKNLQKPDSTHSGWDIAEGTALRDFSAAGYFFGKNLNHDLNVPVGIISSAVSGSRIEPWAPLEAFESVNYFKANSIKIDGDPGKFYGKMIEPLAPFAIRGFLWYQGESNCFLGEAITYTYKMEALINSWRKLWHNDAMPFYYVQIAPYYYSKAKGIMPYTQEREPEFREAQTEALKIPHTGMIITTDLNDNLNNIHPPFKWVVGQRLELVALAKTYGKHNEDFSGPMYKKMKIKGNKIILSFDYADGGLVSHNGKPLDNFSIAGADGKFFSANATIKGDKLIVSSPDVASPTKVRFAWNEAAQPNFYNQGGLPAIPFRTDNPLKFIYTNN